VAQTIVSVVCDCIGAEENRPRKSMACTTPALESAWLFRGHYGR